MYLDPGLAVRHLILPATLRREELAGYLGRWLQEREAIGAPTSVSTHLLYFPFWVTSHEGKTVLEPAAALLVHDLDRFRLPSGDLKSFKSSLASTATIVPASVLLENLAPAQVGARDEVLDTRLVHLPFWEVSFHIGSTHHRMWIDGAGGQVIPLSVPVSSERNLDRRYSLLLAVTYGLLVAGFAALFQGGGVAALGLLLLAGTGPGALWVARRFSE